MSDEILDYVSFNLLPTDSGGVAIFSWLGKQPACNRLCDSLARLADEALPHALARFSFEFFENTCMSPTWWLGLPAKAKAAVTRRHLSGLKSLRRPDCLKDDGLAVVDWKVVSRKYVGDGA